tara:strand:+ start:391 stop:1098 length:708 start_codon:yes stop_codon:yes gene_type:complete
MKKFLIATLVLLGSISLANADRVSVGVSLTGAVFDAEGAKEIFSGNHAGDVASTKVIKNSRTEGEDAEGAFALGSVFAEFSLADQLSLGVSYVPHSSDSEEAQNVQNIGGTTNVPSNHTAEATNKVKVSFEDLYTVYALAKFNENVYAKAGLVQVELITDENLGTGGAYGNDTLEGFTIALGYNMDMADGMFIRGEAMYMEIDGTTLTNANDSTKSVTADGIDGYGATISVGKSF